MRSSWGSCCCVSLILQVSSPLLLYVMFYYVSLSQTENCISYTYILYANVFQARIMFLLFEYFVKRLLRLIFIVYRLSFSFYFIFTRIFCYYTILTIQITYMRVCVYILNVVFICQICNQVIGYRFRGLLYLSTNCRNLRFAYESNRLHHIVVHRLVLFAQHHVIVIQNISHNP